MISKTTQLNSFKLTTLYDKTTSKKINADNIKEIKISKILKNIAKLRPKNLPNMALYKNAKSGKIKIKKYIN